MLKFSRNARAASTGRLSPESQDFKKKKLDNILDEESSDLQPTPECNAKCKEFENLKNIHEDFEKFLDAVSCDLASKSERLTMLKNSGNTNMNDKSYADVQLFMLSQYSHRINRFREVSRSSLEKISKHIKKFVPRSKSL